MMHHAVFADYGQFYGLYRSLCAAKRLANELGDDAVIKEVYDGFTEEEFLSYGWGERAGYWSCLNAIEHGYFGRVKM